LKKRLIADLLIVFETEAEVKVKIDLKIKALALLLAAICAVLTVGLILATQARAADTANSSNVAVVADANGNVSCIPFGRMWNIALSSQFRQGPRGMGWGFAGNIEVSAGYNSTVNTILSGDTDVQSLIAQGYNVTAIRPIVTNTVQVDGTVTAKATTAIVMLQKDTTGIAFVRVNVDQAKVEQIVIVTRTVIDKTAG
jgi:hypothetical protein